MDDLVYEGVCIEDTVNQLCYEYEQAIKRDLERAKTYKRKAKNDNNINQQITCFEN